MATKILKAACLAAVLPAAAGVLAGCTGSTSGERVVFPASSSARWSGGGNIDSITNIGVPLTVNRADSAVHLLSVHLTDPPRAAHLIGVSAYSSRGLSYSLMPFSWGSLPAECPAFFGHPRPVTAITVPAKSQAHWIITVTLTIPKPGTYHFRHAKITYTINGHKAWQYADLNLTLTFKAPPDRRQRIEPTSEVC